MITMKTIKKILSIFLLLLAPSVGAQSFYDFDVDGDGQLDPELYRQAHYPEEEVSQVQTVIVLSEAEFGDFDKDRDQRIAQEEWLVLSEDPERNIIEEEDWSIFDGDHDGRINEVEWSEDFDSATFGDFDHDEDGFLDDNEFMEGIFFDWDADGDSYLDEDEYTTAHTEMWD